MNPTTTARVAAGIAILLLLIAVLAFTGHESVVDRGVNFGTAPVRAGAKAAKTAGQTAALAAAA